MSIDNWIIFNKFQFVLFRAWIFQRKVLISCTRLTNKSNNRPYSPLLHNKSKHEARIFSHFLVCQKTRHTDPTPMLQEIQRKTCEVDKKKRREKKFENIQK